jgi:hypothetical protein
MRHHSVLTLSLLCSVSFAQSAPADDSIQKALNSCSSEGQTVSYETTFVPGKPATEPATAEEEERVKQVLAKAGMPYDRVNHQSTYIATLSMVRAKQHIRVKIAPATASPVLDATRKCIEELIEESGVSGEVVN